MRLWTEGVMHLVRYEEIGGGEVVVVVKDEEEEGEEEEEGVEVEVDD